jgi:hypothetical protein
MPWRRGTAPSPEASPHPGPVPPVPSALAAWADRVEAIKLNEKTVRNAQRFLADNRSSGSLGSRRETALRLRTAIEAQLGVPAPPSASSMDVIAAALAARRRSLG